MIQPTSESVCVPARISSLPQLLAMLSTQPHAPDQVPPFLRAQLAVEELFVNTIRHGYGQESDHPVWLTVEQDGTVLRVVYADQAYAFDPLSPNFSTGDGDDVGATRSEHRVGGLGHQLIIKLARHGHYTREAGRNVTLLEFALAPAMALKTPAPDHPRRNGPQEDFPLA